MKAEKRKENEVVVIKIGSELIADKVHRQKIVQTIHAISQKVNVIVVASGAVAEGRKLNPELDKKITDLQTKITEKLKSFKSIEEAEKDKEYQKLVSELKGWKQSAFTIGNTKVIEVFQEEFGEEKAGPVLTTHRDLDNETSKNNFINLLQNNISLGILSVINENDAISTAEITYGDNDQIGSHLSSTLLEVYDKVTLCLMTSADGVLATPKKSNLNSNKNKHTMRRLDINRLLAFETLEELEELIKHHTWNAEKGVSTGGIVSKIIAAIRAKHSGVNTYILNGEHSEDLFEILDISQENNKIADAINHGQRWTKLVGSALTNKQIQLLEDYIKAHKNIKVQDWDYKNRRRP